MSGAPREPKVEDTSHRGYGNIYTPHAGSMIIQVQRESGLQSRTIVLSPRQVRILSFLTSRTGRIAALAIAAMLAIVVAQAARVPTLTYRLAHMEHDASRLDTLQHSLTELQKRYDQVQRMLGAAAQPSDESFPAATDTLRRIARGMRNGPRAHAAVAAGVAESAQPAAPDSTRDSVTASPPQKSADPMD